MNITHSFSIVMPGFGRLAKLPLAVALAYQTWRRLRRERDQLLAFSCRSLRDLGLSRIDALQAANRPLWVEVRAAFTQTYNSGERS